MVFEVSVNESRHKAGCNLAVEHPCPDADIVIPVPDSGMVAASGYAQESGIKLRPTGIVRNHYMVGRTFIDPDNLGRGLKTKLKLSPNRHLLNGRKIVMVDDSIVRDRFLAFRQFRRIKNGPSSRETLNHQFIFGGTYSKPGSKILQ